jgi:hypothetical protein
MYCTVDRKGTGALYPRDGRARDFVNFRENIYASRARRGRAVLKGPRPDLTMTGRKSKFGLRHDINLIESYVMTKSEFWFSMIPPKISGKNIRSFVQLNSTVDRSILLVGNNLVLNLSDPLVYTQLRAVYTSKTFQNKCFILFNYWKSVTPRAPHRGSREPSQGLDSTCCYLYWLLRYMYDSTDSCTRRFLSYAPRNPPAAGLHNRTPVFILLLSWK